MKQVILKRVFYTIILFYSVLGAARAEFELVLDINESGTKSFITRFTYFNETLFFTTNNSELWKSDGTREGTIKLFDSLKREFTFSRLLELPVLEDGVYFLDDSDRVRKTDGSVLTAPVVYTPDITSDLSFSDSRRLVRSGSQLFFFESRFTRSVIGGYRSELRTVQSGQLGSQIVMNFDNYNFRPYSLEDFNNRLVFTASLPFFDGQNDSLSDYEPYISDGTPNGTVLIKDIFTNGGDMEGQGSNPSRYTAVGDDLFFVAQVRAENTTGGRPALFKTDGTGAGTSEVFDLSGKTVTKLFNFNGVLVLILNSNEIWISNEINDEIEFVKNISSPTPNGPSFISSVPESVSNELIFYFFTSDKKMWKSDGSPSGTVSVADFTRSSIGISPVKLEGLIYFINQDLDGSTIWTSDGTTDNTKELEIDESVSMSSLTVFDNKIYVSANTETVNNGLYVIQENIEDTDDQTLCIPLKTNRSKIAVICI